MKVYRCDSCKKVVENPHKEHMKEFYVGVMHDCGITTPFNTTRKVKIHLCDNCFSGLKTIAQNTGFKGV